MLVQPLRYDTPADVSRRLYQTFIRYRGEAVFVLECFEDLTINVAFLARPGYDESALKHHKRIHSSDVDLDIESPELGWTFIKFGSTVRPIYCLRTIHRQFSQGVDPRRVLVFDPCRADTDLPLGITVRTLQDYAPFAAMIEGTPRATLEEATKTSTGMPLNIQWAIANVAWTKKNEIPSTYTIFHGFHAIGTLHPKTRRLFFARGHLTKTRRIELAELLSRDPKGYQYAVEEQP